MIILQEWGQLGPLVLSLAMGTFQVERKVALGAESQQGVFQTPIRFSPAPNDQPDCQRYLAPRHPSAPKLRAALIDRAIPAPLEEWRPGPIGTAPASKGTTRP